MRLTDDADVLEPLRFLRQREIVHFQRFGEALSLVQQRLDFNNFYAFNPEFDKKCKQHLCIQYDTIKEFRRGCRKECRRPCLLCRQYT